MAGDGVEAACVSMKYKRGARRMWPEPNGDRPLLQGEINCRLAMFIAEFVLAYGVCPRLVSSIRKYGHEIRRAINNNVWLDGVLQNEEDGD